MRRVIALLERKSESKVDRYKRKEREEKGGRKEEKYIKKKKNKEGARG